MDTFLDILFWTGALTVGAFIVMIVKLVRFKREKQEPIQYAKSED